MASDFSQLVDGRPRRVELDTVTAKVVRIDGGVYAVALDDDTRHPIGPCRGPADIAVDDIVLLVETSNDQPWVVQVDAQPES